MIGSLDLADKLWQDSRREISQALHHPFIRQLGNGSLPRYRSCEATRSFLVASSAKNNRRDKSRGNQSIFFKDFYFGCLRPKRAPITFEDLFSPRRGVCFVSCSGMTIYQPPLHKRSLPFVRRHSFQFYIAQDAHFLAGFFAAYQSAFRKAVEERDEDAEQVLRTLLQGVAKELELHASYAKVPIPSSGF